MIIGSSISNENEIIVSVSVIYQNEGGVTGGIVAGVTNIEDKKIEKNEKREKGVKSNSKLNIKIDEKYDEETEILDDSERDKVNAVKGVKGVKGIKAGKAAKIVKKREELSINNYDTLLVVKYKIDELKKLCTKYKISKCGNKEELIKRLYEYCKNSAGPLKIQKVFRGFLNRRLHKLQGPALMNRKICTNDTDFFTMDDMVEIPATQFYSYRDDDNFVYGFDIVSLYNLIKKEGLYAKNPYNRNEFDNKVKENVMNMIRISKVLKIPVDIDIKNEVMDPVKRMELKILELFQTMNSYGNYANSEWFSQLPRNLHIRFARELVDIWNYRALLTVAKKQEICPPHGNPFLGTPYYINVASNAALNNISNETLVKYNVQIIENLVKSAVDIDNKMLGTFYVLSALTLVSQSARDAMPWLYDAVVYIP
jgi:hypothetical protein